jgi:putative endonuclease
VKGFVYILRSLKNDSLYIGSTRNVHQRIKQHQRGGVAATKYILPIRLEFYQEYDNIELAGRVERKLKSFKRRDFIEKVVKEKIIKAEV